jgi:hypothetical protein
MIYVPAGRPASRSRTSGRRSSRRSRGSRARTEGNFGWRAGQARRWRRCGSPSGWRALGRWCSSRRFRYWRRRCGNGPLAPHSRLTTSRFARTNSYRVDAEASPADQFATPVDELRECWTRADSRPLSLPMRKPRSAGQRRHGPPSPASLRPGPRAGFAGTALADLASARRGGRAQGCGGQLQDVDVPQVRAVDTRYGVR